jgi:hypothetical protein
MGKNGSQIIETYKGVNIRTINRVVLRLDPIRFKKIIDEVDKTGLSIQKLLAYSGKPCEKCKDVCVVIYGKEGELIHIKRGILHVPESNGCDIITKAKNRCKNL